MKQRNAPATHQKDALEQLVKFYTAWGQPDKAAAWQRKLAEFNAAEAAKPNPAE